MSVLAMVMAATLGVSPPSGDGSIHEMNSTVFGARCSRGSEMIGHPIPGYADVAHGIVNMFPIALKRSPKTLLGYVYATQGGRSYFVASQASYRTGLFKTGDGQAIPIGSNRAASRLGSEVLKVIAGDLRRPEQVDFLLTYRGGGHACFVRDWNQKVTP